MINDNIVFYRVYLISKHHKLLRVGLFYCLNRGLEEKLYQWINKFSFLLVFLAWQNAHTFPHTKPLLMQPTATF